MALTTWIDNGAVNKVLDFETSLVDQIMTDYQAFTITESSWFQTIIKAIGCDQKILKGDAITNRVQARVARIEQENSELLEKTYVTITLSLNRQTSQNLVPFLGINTN